MTAQFLRNMKSELQRAVISRRMIGSSLLITALLLFSASGFMDGEGECGFYLMNLAMEGSGNAQLILCMIPLIPYAVSYAEDYRSRAVPFQIQRVRWHCQVNPIGICFSFCWTGDARRE